jgi:hypothetical protein
VGSAIAFSAKNCEIALPPTHVTAKLTCRNFQKRYRVT